MGRLRSSSLLALALQVLLQSSLALSASPRLGTAALGPIRSQLNKLHASSNSDGLAEHTAGLRIINGAEAQEAQFPWQAALLVDSSSFCGGSIISEEWILTAAHCVDGYKHFHVTVGSLKSYPGSSDTSAQIFETTEKYRHKQYNNYFYDNDIALLHLTAKKIIFTTAVAAVRLPSYTDALRHLEGKTATISGWGHTSDAKDARVSEVLRYTELEIVADKVCFEQFGSLMISNKICCSGATGHSTCEGDSGGALVIAEDDGKYTQVGLTSFGSTSGCTKKLPVVFTKITSFLDFIESVTNIKVKD